MAQRVRSSVIPQCVYCKFGDLVSENDVVCPKKGVAEPNYSCSKFKYDPLKREPEKRSVFKTPVFDESAFQL